MSAELPERSSAIRFLDAFLQEQNIKWMLGLGLMILLGSSTMLVTNHWQDYTPLWKSLILFGYTFSIHLCGQISYHSLQLRKTGTGLMALTVLLIPLDFLALRWIHPQDSLTWTALFGHVGHLALLLGLCVCSTLAAKRILLHFLRKTQTTFLVSYLVLCFCGAIVPSAPASWAIPLMLTLWGVFAAGSMKANRHVFWLTEEQRLPRIFGFFPLLLLGTQFFTIYAVGLAHSLSIAWLGLGLVLTAIPVLLAVDVLTDVIQKRQLDLTGPYPASIAIALFCGLTLTLAGVVISGIGYPQVTVLVPTTALAAGMMLMTGRRTNKVGLIWMAILIAMTAYQTSPVFFKDVAIAVRNQGAAAIHEERLPFAFYGLTYLPLVSLCSVLAWWSHRRGDSLLAVPLRQFSLGLPALLLPLSLTHAKAIFPVGLALTVYFGWQLWLTRDRRVLVAAVLALLSATAGFATFVQTVAPELAFRELPLIAATFVAVALVIPGRRLDQWASRFSSAADDTTLFAPCQAGSLVLTVATTVAWFPFSTGTTTAIGLAAFLTILWLKHAMIWRNELLSALALIAPIVLLATLTKRFDWEFVSQLWLATLVTTALSVGSRILSRVPHWKISRTFHQPALAVAIACMVLLQCQFCLLLVIASFTHSPALLLPVTLLALSVGCELAWRVQSRGLTILNWVTALCLTAWATAARETLDLSILWIPFSWAVLAAIFVGRLIRRHRGASLADVARPGNVVISTLEGCVLTTLLIIASGSLPAVSNPLRLAGAIAAGASLVLTYRRYGQPRWNFLLLLTNGLVLAEVLRWTGDQTGTVANGVTASQVMPLAFVAGLSTLFWQRQTKHSPLFAEMVVHILEGCALLAILQRDSFVLKPLPVTEILLLAGTIGLLITLHLTKAMSVNLPADHDVTPEQRQEKEDHVWWSEALVAYGCLQLAWFDLLPLQGNVCLFVPLFLAGIAWGISRWSAKSIATQFLQRPMEMTAMTLPAVTVALGLSRQIHVVQTEWQGMNSLALLLAAGFYFWQGLERGKPSYQFLAAGILNLATSFLWLELHWSDPQLFLIPLGLSILGLVELLRAQIPAQLHTPLSYAGALTILVSPTFHIVEGSWLHLISLMVISVLVVLLAMGLRVRVLMFTGTAFLIADLISMIVRASYDNPSVLWLAGIAIGAAVVALAAYCERHREQMLQQLRFLAARMESWR